MNTNDQHHATEPSVAEMASMIDFGDGRSQTVDNQTADHNSDENNNNFIDVEAIEEEHIFTDEEFNPEKNITRVGFRKDGKAKLALVSIAGLAVIVGGTTFFQGQMPREKIAEAPKKKDPLSEQVETAQTDVTKAQQSESETKSELALSKQKDALDQANNNKTNDPTSDKTDTNPNTKVATGPAPSVPIVPPIKPSRAGGFVASPIVPPLSIPPNNTTRAATVTAAPFVLPANRNNISIPPAGVQPLQTVSAPKLATTPVGSLINKNAASIALPTSGSTIKAIAQAPGITKTPVVETASAKPPIKEITKFEPTRSSSIKENPTSKKRPSEDSEERPLPRLPIARAPGIAADTEIASNTLPPPSLYPATPQPGINSLAPRPFGTPSTIAPVAINSAPSLTDFLRTSAAADTPIASLPPKAIASLAPQATTNIPVSQSTLIAMNKDQSKEKQLFPGSKPVLQLVPVPNGSAPNSVVAKNKQTNLIASSGIKNSYSSLVSPNSPLTDIIDAPSLGVSVATAAPDTIAQAIKPALTQGVAPGINSTRPAYAYTKMLLAGLPDSNISLGNTEQVSSSNQQINQVNKSQVVTQNNPLLNQPVSNPPAQNTPSTTILGTPVNPVSPTAPPAPAAIGPIAASILTGTSAKGTTLTPILWGSDSANGAKFVAKLEEPLLANNKREALPAGTQLIVMARPSSNGNSGVNSSSLVEVDVVGVIVQGKEYATPPGAIVIHDENNGLLVGEDYFKREDQIASRDYMTVLGGALNTLGQVLNRPSGSFSSNSSGFGSSSTNIINNRDPNIFGALLEGGFKDIPGIWNQRNQQALAQLANQPKVYQIPKGRTIRVFVNQSIIF
jgi:Bacterial conjugation TrbI-like protein